MSNVHGPFSKLFVSDLRDGNVLFIHNPLNAERLYSTDRIVSVNEIE